MTRFDQEPDDRFGDRLPVLDRLEREFARLAEAEGSPRWWRRFGTAGLLSLLAVLGVSAVAVAAVTGVFGSPVSDSPGSKPQPTVGAGVPQAGSRALTALRVADPVGGPAWGLRLTRTTRQQGCVQVGRVVNGQLGVLGQNGQFQNDGRFHPLPLNVASQQLCTPLDGAGRPFIAVAYSGLPASGQAAGCLAPDTPPPPASLASETQQPPPRCPRQDMRALYYGALGPDAVAVTYRDGDGKEQSAATTPGDGAYLVVTRPPANRRLTGGFTYTTSPSSGLTSVRYRDGSQCRIANGRRLGGARHCPKRGYLLPRGSKVTAAQVATPVQLQVEPGTRQVTTPGSSVATPPERRVHIRFRARVAAIAQASYDFELTTTDAARCEFGTLGGSVNRDVQAGELVVLPEYVPARCSGRITGAVRYRAHEPQLGTGRFRDGLLVGRFSAEP